MYYKELKQLKEDGENENALYEKINIENELKKNEVIEEKWDKNELG